MAEHGFCSYINTPTSQSCLDLCLLIIPLNKKDSFNITPILLTNDISGHFPILLNISYKTKLHNKPTLPATNFNIKYEKLELLLRNETWQDVCLRQNVNVDYDTFINNLLGKIQQSTTMANLKISEKKLKPRISKGLIKSIRKRDKIKFELNKNNVQLLQQYKVYRNKINNLIKISKKDYYMCEVFNKFFVNIGKDLASKINPVKGGRRNTAKINPYSIFLAQINEERIRKTILRLKDHKAPGVDQIKI